MVVAGGMVQTRLLPGGLKQLSAHSPQQVHCASGLPAAPCARQPAQKTGRISPAEGFSATCATQAESVGKLRLRVQCQI